MVTLQRTDLNTPKEAHATPPFEAEIGTKPEIGKKTVHITPDQFSNLKHDVTKDVNNKEALYTPGDQRSLLEREQDKVPGLFKKDQTPGSEMTDLQWREELIKGAATEVGRQFQSLGWAAEGVLNGSFLGHVSQEIGQRLLHGRGLSSFSEGITAQGKKTMETWGNVLNAAVAVGKAVQDAEADTLKGDAPWNVVLDRSVHALREGTLTPASLQAIVDDATGRTPTGAYVKKLFNGLTNLGTVAKSDNHPFEIGVAAVRVASLVAPLGLMAKGAHASEKVRGVQVFEVEEAAHNVAEGTSQGRAAPPPATGGLSDSGLPFGRVDDNPKVLDMSRFDTGQEISVSAIRDVGSPEARAYVNSEAFKKLEQSGADFKFAIDDDNRLRLIELGEPKGATTVEVTNDTVVADDMSREEFTERLEANVNREAEAALNSAHRQKQLEDLRQDLRAGIVKIDQNTVEAFIDTTGNHTYVTQRTLSRQQLFDDADISQEFKDTLRKIEALQDCHYFEYVPEEKVLRGVKLMDRQE